MSIEFVTSEGDILPLLMERAMKARNFMGVRVEAIYLDIPRFTAIKENLGQRQDYEEGSDVVVIGEHEEFGHVFMMERGDRSLLICDRVRFLKSA